jgi:hypothetical protein
MIETAARAAGLKASQHSYNTRMLRAVVRCSGPHRGGDNTIGAFLIRGTAPDTDSEWISTHDA